MVHGWIATMFKASMLVPVNDNDGTPFLTTDWDALHLQMRVLGGWTVDHDVEGFWTDDSGQVYADVSERFTLALTTLRQIPAFLEMAEWTRVRFRQRTIYVEVAGVPDILGPPP